MPKQEQSDDLEVTFTGVCVHRKNSVHVSSVVDEYEDDGQDHALIFSLIDGKWTHRPIENSIGGLCVIDEPKPKVLNMGVDGEITIFTLPGFQKEIVDTSARRPSYSVHLRSIRKIGNHVYVAGMARQVYRREEPGHWVSIDAGVYLPRGSRAQAVGFDSLDGTDEKNICAVGHKGEIWRFNGSKWSQDESPTNVALTCIRYARNSEMYACGMAGVLLHGTAKGWRIIPQTETTKDFWGLSLFRNNIYLSNYDGIFVLDGKNLRKVKTQLPKASTTAFLDSNEDVLWSVGHKDLAYTEDGIQWHKVQSP